MERIVAGGREFTVRRTVAGDVPALVALLRDDVLGAARETAPPERYDAAFAMIDADPAQHLVVVRDEAGEVVGTMQLTLVPGLSRGGALRLQVEGVRLAGSVRGTGLGSRLFAWAHEWGRSRGATLAQLTTDASRADARRFYERLGYRATHVGMKLDL